MATKLLLPGIVLGVGLMTVVVQHLLVVNDLLHLTYDFSVHDEHLAELNRTCSWAHRDKLIGCEDIQLVGNSIYAACLSDFENRHKYNPTFSRNHRNVGGDKVFRWDLESDRVIELELRDFPGKEDSESRSYHGLDVNELPDGTVSIYVINHLIPGSVIDKFTHDPSTAIAKHVARIPTTGGDAPNHPNDIFALPELDGELAMYVTNDHYYADGALRTLEYYLRRPWAHVSYYSKSTGWKKVIPNVAGANGITGDKDPKGRKIYVSEIVSGVIRVLESATDKSPGDLNEVQKVNIHMLGDNVGLFGGDLYVAGVVRGHMHEEVMKDPLSAKKGTGMVVKRFNTKQLGSAFFGGGYTADPVVETLILDTGKLGNSSTTAIFVPGDGKKAAEEEGYDELEDTAEQDRLAGTAKGVLYLTGLVFFGVLKCPIS